MYKIFEITKSKRSMDHCGPTLENTKKTLSQSYSKTTQSYCKKSVACLNR